MRKRLAQTALYGGSFALLASAFAEMQSAKTWAEVLTPEHVFGLLSALTAVAGALYHPEPGGEKQ